MENANVRSKGGWTKSEEELLFSEAKAALGSGKPVKSVFDRVAEATGRRPNSIRNFYYLKLKETDELSKCGFVPFSPEEVESLLRTMLTEQANGRSVRSIAMGLGNSDKKAMLRYQNKYRSVVRSDPDLVGRVMAQLEAEGEAYIDPYLRRPKEPEADLSLVVSGLVKNLRSAGTDAQSFLLSLSALVERAANGGQRAPSALDNELARARKTNEQLSRRLSELVSLNRDFLALSGMQRLSELGDYLLAVRSAVDEPAKSSFKGF